MPRSSRSYLLPRFSLRTFLLICLVATGGVAWFSHNYRAYVAEQKVIEKLTKSGIPGGYVSVSTNGQPTTLAGSLFL